MDREPLFKVGDMVTPLPFDQLDPNKPYCRKKSDGTPFAYYSLTRDVIGKTHMSRELE